jgi:hypothetical protein
MNLGTLKDGTPIDAKFVADTVFAHDQEFLNLLQMVVGALPHLHEEAMHMVREHGRIHVNLCDELRRRAASEAPR